MGDGSHKYPRCCLTLKIKLMVGLLPLVKAHVNGICQTQSYPIMNTWLGYIYVSNVFK